MRPPFDVAIVGAGPAGTAAAIFAASKGLKVSLIESLIQPKRRPGESLPPGVESIFRQLGVWKPISKLKLIRHAGHYILENNQTSFHAYGQDAAGKWLGIQIYRNILDAILQKRACELGVTMFRQCHIKSAEGRITCISSKNHSFTANFYIDATGSSHLFSRLFSINMHYYSEKLVAQYGYRKDLFFTENLPIFIKNKDGWCWYAEVEQDVYAWVALGKTTNKHETMLAGGADVTWRIAETLAKDQFFLVGDAACVLDPSSGHGILRALMTGMMAAFLIDKIIKKEVIPDNAYSYYHQWLRHWFFHDTNLLNRLASNSS